MPEEKVITSKTVSEMPRVWWSANEADELVSVTITGLPVCGETELEDSAICRILQAYKRLLISGVYGRTKTEHARLLKQIRKEALEEYKRQVEEFLRTCPKGRRVELAQALKRRDEPTKGIFIRGMSKKPKKDPLADYNPPEQPEFFLPKDAGFTLPVAYIVKATHDPDTNTQKLTVELFRSGAFPALERMADGNLKALSSSELFSWLAVYGQALAYELQAFFEQAQRYANEHGVEPDYYNYCVD